MGEVDVATPRGQLGAVAVAEALDLVAQRITGGDREERGPIAIAFAPAHEELAPVDADVHHAQGEVFHEAEAAALVGFFGAGRVMKASEGGADGFEEGQTNLSTRAREELRETARNR